MMPFARIATLLTALLPISVCSLALAQAPQSVPWDLRQVHPWINADAASLPSRLTTPARRLELSGPMNDWLTGAVAIASTEKSDVTVTLTTPDALRDRIQLRVVGTIPNGKKRQVVLDGLFTPGQVRKFHDKLTNGKFIKDFPRLTVVPESPAMLWLTVDLRYIAAGDYEAVLNIKDDTGKSQDLPLNIHVLPACLPIQSPLNTLAWQSSSDNPEQIRDQIDHGVNTFWRNHEAAWKQGAKFLMIQFSASFNREPITEKKLAEVKAELDKVWAMIDRLHVPNNCWALNTADETSDQSAQIDLAYARLIKSLRPDTPLCFDPAWGKDAETNQRTTTLEGTIRVIAPVVDVWIPYWWHMWNSKGVREFLPTTGKPVWMYEINGFSGRSPAVGTEMFRTGPLYAWRYHLNGYCFYSLNAAGPDQWNHDKLENASVIYYAGGEGYEGVISTRGYELFRQGIQEYKRFYLLKQLGVPPETLDQRVEKLLDMKTVKLEDFDAMRQLMDQELVKLTADAQAPKK